MLRKLIILIMLCTSMAYGQSSTGWDIVTTQGTNLYQNGSIIAPNISDYFQPAYGSMTISASPLSIPFSIAITNGIMTNNVSTIQANDAIFAVVNEQAGQAWKLDMSFTNEAGLIPHVIDLSAYYNGSLAHNVKVQIWNYTAGAYTNVTTASTDFDYDGTESDYSFPLPGVETNYVSSGVSKVRINHTSAGVGTHEFGLDFITVLGAQLEMPSNGTFYAVTPMMASSAVNLTANTNTATFSDIPNGDYYVSVGGTGTGKGGTTYKVYVFTNGVESGVNFWRTVRDEGDWGNAVDTGIISLTTNDSVTVKVTATQPNAFASYENFHFNLNKIGN